MCILHDTVLDWDEFEWDQDNEDHIADHDVDPYEAEEAVFDLGAIPTRDGKDRFGNVQYTYIGKTEDGRILFLVVSRKGQGLWRIGTARDADPGERKIYRKRNR
jgi:uncharacterized DUF497 family protein